MARSSTEYYEWLTRVTNLIRAQKEPQEQDLFEIFVKELGQVLQFDFLTKYDAVSNTFSWYAGPTFEELNEELKTSAINVDKQTGESKILPLWVYEHQETIVLGNLDNEARFPDTIRCMRRAGLRSLCGIPLTDAHRRLEVWRSPASTPAPIPRKMSDLAPLPQAKSLSRSTMQLIFARLSEPVIACNWCST